MHSLSKPLPSASARPWLVGGSVLLAACAAWFTLRRSRGKSAPTSRLGEEQVFDILREFRKEFYPFLKELAGLSQRLQEGYFARLGGQPENIRQLLHQHLVDENSAFEQRVEAIELRVLARHNVADPDDFKAACQALAKKSPRVAQIMREIRAGFEKAVLGVVIPIMLSTPGAVSKDAVSEHFVDMTQLMARKLAAAAQEFRAKHGAAAFKTRLYSDHIHGLTSSIDPDRYVRLYPADLVRDYHVSQLFSFGMNHHSKADPKFARAVDRLTGQNKKIIEAIHTEHCDYEQVFAEIEAMRLDEEEREAAAFYIDEAEREDDWHTNKDEESQHDAPAEEEEAVPVPEATPSAPVHHEPLAVEPAQPEPALPAEEVPAPESGPRVEEPDLGNDLHSTYHVNKEHPGPVHPLFASKDVSVAEPRPAEEGEAGAGKLH